MATNSKIEWTEATWNPVTGCDKISPGCKNCYAEKLAKRLQAMGQANYANGFDLTLQPHMLGHPLTWKRPRRIFVNSMSDLFHHGVPLNYIKQVFDVAKQASWHTFQILTKRSERLAYLAPHLKWPCNVWMGVSVERNDYLFRIDHLRRVPAIIRFLSLEPLLGPLDDLNLEGIHWVIAGGESGPNARPMHPDWVRGIRDKCSEAGVPFFFKQWGEWKPCRVMSHDESDALYEPVPEGVSPDTHTRKCLVNTVMFPPYPLPQGGPCDLMFRVGKKAAGRTLDSREWSEFPEVRA